MQSITIDSVCEVLDRLNVPTVPAAVAIGSASSEGTGRLVSVRSPIDGSELATFTAAAPRDVAHVVEAAGGAFRRWQTVPAPKRGELVRRIGQKLRDHKADLATLISWEAGKIRREALGEVQEMIDVCDFAVGLSRQLYGLSIASERPGHRLSEQWHPLGPVGLITAFNSPMGAWAAHAMIGLVAGDPIVWKPSEKTPLSAIACQRLVGRLLEDMPHVPRGVVSLIVGGGPEVGQTLAASKGLPLVCATGSVRMGRDVAIRVARRLGRSLLELGGNSGMIVAPSANLDLTLQSIMFSALATAGQRSTTLRRLIAHDDIADVLLERLLKVYPKLPVGDPLDEYTLVGPLIDPEAVEIMNDALQQARSQGGIIHGGGPVADGVPHGGNYVWPAIVEISPYAPIVQRETFAPILYLMRYTSLEEAVAIHNDVPQGLASSIFTGDVREAEFFCSAAGSDCGVVNVNAPTNGAEIGAAFGGEKQTGGGRESGSDAWKAYMRRATNTINYSSKLPAAEDVRFDV